MGDNHSLRDGCAARFNRSLRSAMRWRRPAKNRRGRPWGITFVILGLVHAPLPEADFHNIRHHDAPGEVCEYHDHLLRWHPDAVMARDVAVLHWHWFWPGDASDTPSEDSPLAVFHAHAPGWLTGIWNVDGPIIVPDVASRSLDRSSLPSLDIALARAILPPLSRDPRGSHRARPRCARNFAHLALATLGLLRALPTLGIHNSAAANPLPAPHFAG